MVGDAMTEYVKAWQCIGCGKIEAPQTCVGVCQDRKVELVYAHDHRAALAQTQLKLAAAESLLRQMAFATPRLGEWERSYLALQRRVRQALGLPMALQPVQVAESVLVGAVPDSK